MYSNKYTNSGSGAQNVATGSGAQNNNTGSGTQQNNFGPLSGIVQATSVGEPSSRRDRPSRREDFHIGIICALTIEFNAVSLVFDTAWDEDGDSYGRASGDTNTYTTGRIGKHDVVLTLLPNMGTASAAGAAASFRSSFPALRLVLLVGVCGGVPESGGNEALLGDVVISKHVQHSLSKQYPDKLELKDTIDDNLGRLNKDLRSLVASFGTDIGQDRLYKNTGVYLRELQSKAAKTRSRANYGYPGVDEDKLFQPHYRHEHHAPGSCGICNGQSGGICEQAKQASCAELNCDEIQLICERKRLETKRRMLEADRQLPKIHIGRIRSGDIVMKSGEHRDQIARKHEVIAFEMEGAGTWDEVPCLVVKGICDYADSHKNKKWQLFAAATAASVSKAILGRYARTDGPNVN
ncbi:Pfs domain-containing protein [Apiospora marii]|uniref:Pfs domain-containing protein n=1 Tax=Apiospora marii TaxID=335849 RepID=UPI00312E665B